MSVENYPEVFLRSFLAFSNFRQLFCENWDADFFDSSEERLLYKILKNWWTKGHKIPTKKEILFDVNTKEKYAPFREKLIAKIDMVYGLDLTDYTESYIRDQFIDILKRHKLRKVLNKVVAETRKTDVIDELAIKTEIVNALNIVDNLQDMGIDYYKDDVLERLKKIQEMERTHFKTHFSDDLDKVLRLKRKTVVAVSAQLGVGKSLFLNNLAVNMTKDGLNILYLSLEMDALDISKRIDRILLGLNDEDYFNNMELVEKKTQEFKKENPKHGKLFIRGYTPRSVTSSHIRSLLEAYKLNEVPIDVVLVDYLTLMRPNKDRGRDDNMYQRGKDIAEELEAIAKDEKCLIFTALQVKGEAYGKHKQGAELVAESLAIPQVIDTVINMVEALDEENEEKYFIINSEKVRDSKKTGKRIFLKLKDNLEIVDTTVEEKTKLEELVSKKKKAADKAKSIFHVDIDDENLQMA
jgi:replicative DNA helicase